MVSGRGLGRLSGFAALIATALLATVGKAGAGERGLQLGTEIDFELEDEFVFAAEDEEVRLNEAFATIEAEVRAARPRGSGVYLTAVLEPVTDAEADRAFKDFGLYLEEVYLALRRGRSGVRLGKFNPPFGLSSDLAPGLFGDELAGDYELSERIGIGVWTNVAAFGAEHALDAAVFLADRTPLSGSLFTGRERLRRRDGGVSNTARPGSFALAGLSSFEAGTIHMGLRYQEAGEGDNADEFGAVLGGVAEREVLGLDALFFAEAAHFPAFDGETDWARFLTLGAEVEPGALSASAALGLRRIGDDEPSRLATFSLALALGRRWELESGYRFLDDEEDGQSHTLGIRISRSLTLP